MARNSSRDYRAGRGRIANRARSNVPICRRVELVIISEMGTESTGGTNSMGASLRLRCGVTLKNRLVKAAMSDSLGDGAGRATDAQLRLYRRWMVGGAGLLVIGEVQVDSRFPEKPGNLVLDGSVDHSLLRGLAELTAPSGGHIWPQLGHAGAMSHPPVSDPAGPSALELDGLSCSEMAAADIEMVPKQYGAAARRARQLGFSGVEIHAAHGFLLSQFLSPLFNRRRDRYGGSIEARSRPLLAVVDQVRHDAGPDFAIGVKINATDELEHGLAESDALAVVEMLGQHSVDLVNISGGTYFPGAASSSDRPSSGPYYADFARRARGVTDTALMLTGGVKTRSDAVTLLSSGVVDLVGLARPLVLDPDLPNKWIATSGGDPDFPRFDSPPPGGVTAWYTMRLADMAEGREPSGELTPENALDEYNSRDASRVKRWNDQFRTDQTRRP